MLPLAMARKERPKIRLICLEAWLGYMSNTMKSIRKNPSSI